MDAVPVFHTLAIHQETCHAAWSGTASYTTAMAMAAKVEEA